MNGLLGLNVRTLGVSRDQILSAVRQLGCAWVLVQDDPDLIAPLKAMGVKTIYRQSGDENLSLSPDQFVQTRAEKGADFVHLTNELDPTPEVLAYTMECMKYAVKIGVKCVINNFATDRSKAQCEAARGVVEFAVAHGMGIGVHVYQRQIASPQSYNWLDLKRQMGGLWLVTEYAFYVDAYHGWRGVLNPAQYGAFLDNTLALFRDEQMPVLLFSGDTWPLSDEGKRSGFGVLDNAAMLGEIARVNAKYVWTGNPVTEPPITHVPPPTTGGLLRVVKSLPGGIQWRNIRTEPDSDADDIGNLVVGDVITEYETSPDNWGYLTRAKDGIEGWALFKGVVTVPVMPAVWTVDLEVPYVNQTNADADISFNDCGIASLLMCQRAWMVARGLIAADIPTVDDLIPYTPLSAAHPPNGLTFAQIGALSKQLGYLTQYVQPLTEAQLVSFLDMGTPVMVLVSYMVFNPGHGNFAHIAVVNGYNATLFLCQNPYDNGRDYTLPRTQLMRSMSSSPGNSIGYQAMTLTLLP